MKEQYVGITIGPIFDTVNMSSSPAALWQASYLFSAISKEICAVLAADHGVSAEDIITPFFDPQMTEICGVGMYPDRIIFRKGTFKIAGFSAVKNTVIGKIAEVFDLDPEYLAEYLLISAAEFEAENPILDSGSILDNLELAKPFVRAERCNPFVEIDNEKVKGLPLVQGWGESWQLRNKQKNIRSLPEIARSGEDDTMKKHHYYAIVRSDGDNMSKIIRSLDTAKEIRNFSNDCLTYCRNMAEVVKMFGGMTIYAGGDDLLAILPCDRIFAFVQEANKTFSDCFKSYGEETSLSFGIVICYHKFPLYEALAQSADLLFKHAKFTKNCLAICLQKHSGQSEGLIIHNDMLERVVDLQKRIVENTADDVLLSALHKIALFQAVFNNCADEQEAKNLFCNTFDADAHEGNVFLKEFLPEFFVQCVCDKKISALTNEGRIEDRALVLGYLLRLMKFYVEKKGEEERV